MGIYIFLSPQQDGARGRIVRMARVLGRLVGLEDRARIPIAVIIREIEQGDEAQRAQTIALLRNDSTGAELAQVFPHLIRAMKDESEMVRNAAATVVGDLSQRFSGEAPAAEEALTALLDDPSPAIRARAGTSLRSIAASGQLDTPPPRLVACLEDEDEQLRIRGAEALVAYRKGPELIVSVALRRLPTESPGARNAFTDLFWHHRLEASVLPLLIAGLSSENTEVRLICAAAINHMGQEARPALPAILSLIRKEIGTHRPDDSRDEHERIIGMAAGAIGEITSDGECPPGCVEILCEILQRPQRASGELARAGLDLPSLQGTQEECQAEAVWSLGILGRPAAPAVQVLLSTFDSAREASNLRGLSAESLAEISRGTPEEDRVLARLTRSWKTARREQKTAIARALRRLGPKSEELVAELGQWPVDSTGSQLRRVRYPR
jgi:HEAT repeat protein